MEQNFSDQLKFLKELDAVIEERVKARINSLPGDPYESESTNELAEALSKAIGEFHPIKFNRTSNWFQSEYADLDTIMNMVRPVLSKHGLTIYFYTEISDKTILHTKLKHSSGQWIETRARLIPNKDDLKTVESAMNHTKRQQLMALLGITIKGDQMDDDAAYDMGTRRDEFAHGKPAAKVNAFSDPDTRTITKEQLEELEYELADSPDIAEQILTAYRIQHLADMPQTKYLTAISKTRTLKATKNSLKK